MTKKVITEIWGDEMEDNDKKYDRRKFLGDDTNFFEVRHFFLSAQL